MKIHLIGIGGIGVSALAQYYLSKGHQVSGSDLVASEITNFLKKKGVKIVIGNYAKNIEKDFDLVIYSPAVKKNNKELSQAKKYKINTISYPEAIGELTKEYYTIAIAGAHGKSTTTAMIGLVLEKAGLDPTIIVGTKVKEFGDSNFRAGKSKLLVIEACEYDSSFLYYFPKIIVITNVDKEHLDYFKTFKNVINAFAKFIVRLPLDGFLVFNKDDQNIPQIAGAKFKTIDYSISQQETQKIKKIMQIPGEHNILHALSALQVARILEIPDEIVFKALSEFKGTWRRFEIIESKINNKKIVLISDYAHHPNEIKATLEATEEMYNPPSHKASARRRKIWCVFQPHQHQRTFYLFDDFVKILKKLPTDNIIITDIYDVAGREAKSINKGVNSKKLVEKINKENVIYLPKEKIKKHIEEKIDQGDVLVIMGAGDIYKLVDKF
jgi:UDP-N-acetylmuramate--alanine ligase